MTITETAPDAEATEPSASPTENSGDLASIVGTGDHLRIGRLYLGASFLGLIAALVTGLLLDVERVSDTSIDLFGSTNSLVQAMSFQRFGLVFLFALPALLGLAMAVVPLQIGAPTLALPRAAALSFWGWLLGVALWIAGYAVGGGPGGTDLRGTDLWILASIMVIASLLVGTVAVLTTILGLRTEGMSLRRVPTFSFSMLVAGSIWLVTLPVAAANLVLIYLDHRHAQVLWGANDLIVGQLYWLATQPQIYAIAIPVLGIVADQIPVFAGVRQRMYLTVFGAIGLFGFLSLGSWAQHLLTPTDLTDDPLFVAFGVLAVLPLLMVLALGADTMRAGRIRPAAPLLMAVGSLVLLLAATVVGAVHVIEPLELLGTTWTWGHTTLTALAVALGVFSGVWYWAPKLYGRPLAEGVGRILGPAFVLVALVATVPLLLAGLIDDGQVQAIPPGPVSDTVVALNSAAAAGAAAVLLLSLALVLSVVRGRGTTGTPDNPWDGHTLEWATTSPPQPGNFAEAPVVDDERPLFIDEAEEDTSA
jgi:heme/copper-type cytochrome/quinol oxidase subunit 1